MMKRTILITGGAGFIGSHVVRRFLKNYQQYDIVNLDMLTYAGNLENLRDIEDSPNYKFIRGDITDTLFIEKLFDQHPFDAVIHLAAESHVDRSISGPMPFITTNITGTVNLLEAARKRWQDNPGSGPFHHISTDEVYGSLGEEGLFTEESAYDPRSPYSASKASSDHMVRAWFHTWNMPVVISNCSNNYGPNQFPEKLIPLVINNIKAGQPLPVYGKGENIRDWLYVEDHAAAIDMIFHSGKKGETYNVGGNNQWRNIDLVRQLCGIMDRKLGRPAGTSEKLVCFVKDRAGHDQRYAIDNTKISSRLGWKPSVSFEQGLERTVDWYLANEKWISGVIGGNYKSYYKSQYLDR